MSQPIVTAEVVRAHGVSADEYKRIIELLGREPTFTELGIFTVMWSEHCSYKSSRVHLRNLPTKASWVLQGPGENAGIVDVGDGWGAVFKIESHNHPSFIEPHQGAATGVGGILRDVFTMGARPVASLNSLRFGDVTHPKTGYLVEGVVAGIGGYGNSFGCPTVGGDVQFHPSYNGNILVNAFNLGLVRTDRIFRGVAAGVGNPVMYVGSKTGRDGIHGASLLASAEFDDTSESKRPTVQVGDPFTEKLLLDACLELMATDAIVAIQDMGAAGLTSSTAEVAGRGGLGIDLEIDRVPRRESGMSAYEVMLSESQERMLIIARAGREAEIEATFRKWDLDAAVVGHLTDDGNLTVRTGGEIVASIPVKALTDEAPVYERPMSRPAWQDEVQSLDLSRIAEASDYGPHLLRLLASPNLCSREWIYRQYDKTIGSSTLAGPGNDAAVIWIKHTDKALAMSVDVNSRYVYLDPRAGARLAVAEATRNVSTSGALPLGITDCLNFGNPEKPEIMWQFAEAIAGIAEACRALDVPVVSGNVSFYNETDGRAIHPTPTIVAVGVMERPHKLRPASFRRTGDAIVLIGRNGADLGGSEYLARIHGLERGNPPQLDLDLEKRAQALVREALRAEFFASVHDLSEGGLAVALAECCLGPEPFGARVDLVTELRSDELLFGETPSRYIVSMGVECMDGLQGLADDFDVPIAEIGEVGGSSLVIARNGATLVNIELNEVRGAWGAELNTLFVRASS